MNLLCCSTEMMTKREFYSDFTASHVLCAQKFDLVLDVGHWVSALLLESSNQSLTFLFIKQNFGFKMALNKLSIDALNLAGKRVLMR